jgi:hypothetical protein
MAASPHAFQENAAAPAKKAYGSVCACRKLKGSIAAPSMGPGLSRVPAWTITATRSTVLSTKSAVGTCRSSAAPVQLPSLTRWRMTLC